MNTSFFPTSKIGTILCSRDKRSAHQQEFRRNEKMKREKRNVESSLTVKRPWEEDYARPLIVTRKTINLRLVNPESPKLAGVEFERRLWNCLRGRESHFGRKRKHKDKRGQKKEDREDASRRSSSNLTLWKRPSPPGMYASGEALDRWTVATLTHGSGQESKSNRERRGRTYVLGDSLRKSAARYLLVP